MKINILSLICVSLIILPTTHMVLGLDSSEPWPTQATGCNPVSGNINGTIDYVYLGIGSTVPQSILNSYPKASSSFLEAWKTNIVNLTLNQFRSIIIPASQGYTQPSSQLYGKDLFFQVTLLKILNDNGTHIAYRDSVVNVQYSLYTDCQPSTSPNSTSQQSLSSNSTTPVTTTTQSITSTPSTNTSSQVMNSTITTTKVVTTTSGELLFVTIMSILVLVIYKRIK